MHRFSERWPVVLLAVAVVCAGSTIAWSQQFQATYSPVDPAYSAPADLTRTVSMSTQSMFQQTAMSAENSDLAARVEKLEAAANKKPSGMTAKVGGRMLYDMTFYDQDAGSKGFPQEVGPGSAYGDQQNGHEARDVRLSVKGTGFDVFSYGIEMDFADRGRTAFKDTYMQVSELPILGNVKAGFFKEPFSLEELTSSKYITFTERNMANGAFSVARRTGVMAFDQTANERWLWQIGMFSTNGDARDANHDQPPYFEDDRNGSSVTMRFCGTPWYDEATNGRGLLHTGVAYSHRNIADNDHEFSFRPEDHLGDRILSTAFQGIDAYDMLNLQAALVYGPFSVQSEFYMASPVGSDDQQLDGGYVFVSYFLTGENRNYSRSSGAFDRVTPFENFFRVRTEDGSCQTGKGAWEVAYRFSSVDFGNAFLYSAAPSTIAGGTVNNHTVGVNWYLCPNMRVMWNVIHSEADRAANRGGENIFITRAQIDW